MKEGQENCIKINRNNQNYLYIKDILKNINSKKLKISTINYLLLNRKQAFFIYQNSKNSFSYLKQIELLDNSFSFEDMFYMDIKFNPNTNLSTKPEDLEPLILLAENKISVKEAYLRLAKKNKKKSIEAYNIKILNTFEEPYNSILLEIDLNKPLEELQEFLKLAKKFYDKQKQSLKLENEVLGRDNIIDENLFFLFLNKRNSNIPFEEKLIDLLYVIDCLLLKCKSKEIKKKFQEYYIEEYPKLDLSYILNDYYKNLLKEAKNLIPKIKKVV